jgi:hypothetical protein
LKIALIPPIDDLVRWRATADMHLALNHLLEDETYRHFMTACGDAGDWITLDNSAHEYKAGQAIEDVLVNAIAIKARELVIPDTLFHAMFTVQQARQAFKFLDESPLFQACSPTPRLMVVPQGRDVIDWAWCLDQLVETAHAYGFKGLLTIGLSKDYEMFAGGLRRLLLGHLEPYALQGIQTHLLGWTCKWTLCDLAREFSFIRSIDTAKPFIYAMRGHLLTHERPPAQMRRPEDYFHYSFGDHPEYLEIAHHNVAQFKLASRGIRSAPPMVSVP